ncbi:MAG: tetratricopeptide repeat protein, partial [Acidobacteriota bacterium]
VADRPAGAAVEAAAAWLDTLPPDRPFFLWLHLYDPHAPYSPPPPWRDRYRNRLYDGEIAVMDDRIGRLLRHQRVSDGALVTVLGDHGESLGEHGEQTHALLAYDSTLHVPWILHVPGGPRGLRIPQAVGQVDLVPTVLDLLDEDPPDRTAGVSLVPLLEGRASTERMDRTLYGETFLPFYTYGWSKLRVLRQGRMKWIDAPTPELYDTVRDPRELSNLAGQEPGLAHDLARALDERIAAAGPPGERESTLSLDSDARERLRSLGYLAVGSGSSAETARAERPDPKELIDLHVGLERARALSRDRLFPEAERQLRTVLRRDPTNLAAMIDLASVLAETGDLDRAAEVVERALDLDPEYPRLHLQLAEIEARRGAPEKALELVEAALALDARQLDARMRKALLLQQAGHRSAAVATLESALDDEPQAPPLNVLYARIVELGRDPAAAEARVRDALERDPFLVSGWQLLGEILQATGRPDEALDAWRAGLERQPDHAELHASLGVALARRTRRHSATGPGAGREAEAHLREALRLSSSSRLDLRVTLGAWLADRGRFEDAEREYGRVLEADPDHPAARNNRAVAYYQTGRRAEAEREWRELVNRHPRHADAHNNLAALALEAERFDDAARRAERALELTPRMPEAWNNLGLARAGLDDPTAARRCYERALELAPDYWQARLNLGRLLRREGEARRAAETLEELVVRMPGLAEAHLELGHLYADSLGEPGRARAHYNAFLRRAPDDPRAEDVRRRLAELPAAAS